MKTTLKSFFLLLLTSTLLLPADLEDSRLLRFPDSNGQMVVFVYAGDIWSVSTEGGQAVRLTSHHGQELFPKISPDGRWIAFSAEYSGSRQVFVMPSQGGTPRQLTFYNDVGPMPPRGGIDHRVLDWSPDSRQILFRANRTPWGDRMGKYYLVGLAGGLETPLAIPEGGSAAFSPCGRQIVYTPIEREFRTWKRYRGGRAQDVWIYNLEENSSRRLTDFPGTDQHPFWFGDDIFFVSDRDLTLNIYRHHLPSGQVTQVTDYSEYDVLWPSGRNGFLAYENGGQLYLLNLKEGAGKRLPVDIRFDNPGILPYHKEVKTDIASFDISPSGQRAVFEARGDLFSVPAKDGLTLNLTSSQGVREIYPAWSPDGRQIAYYADRSGEYEIYLAPADEPGRARQLTSNSSIWRFPARWSPDSGKLLFSDKNQELQFIEVSSGKKTVIDRADQYDLTYYQWSPDGNWITYVKNGSNGQDAVWVYNLQEKRARQLSSDIFNDFSPVFSRCGQYIFFLSKRDFNLTHSTFEYNYLYTKGTRIFALALNSEVPHLFPPNNETAAISDKTEKKGGSPAERKTRIDFENVEERIMAFPPEAGDYYGLQAIDDGVMYYRNGQLHLFRINEKKEETIMASISAAVLSADGKKILYRSGPNYGIVDVKPGQKPGDGQLDLSGLQMRIEPRLEWTQIFADGWRIFRDWFYVPNLHGVDWEKMRQRYAKLLPSLSHRADLDFIFGELVGEVNAGHAYVNWGDLPPLKRMESGLLGAELKLDEKAGRYFINKIYRGENWDERTRSPLTGPGLHFREGDYLLKINGHEVKAADNPYRFLENTSGRRISLVTNNSPSLAGAREQWITPIKSELELLYLDWVESRRAMVERLSDGRIGYIHVPDTAVAGNRELFRGIYAYRNKEALILDARYNGGGFIPVMMADLVSRTPLHYWARRGLEMRSEPAVVHQGPKAMLINHYSSSGGDAFPYYFRQRNLGPLIGTRTWGGLIGISGNPRFVDGGFFNVPTFGFVNLDGEWDVEGIGVAPDIEVYDLPELIAAGRDPSIEEAVRVLLKELAEKPGKKVKQPADPDRSGWIENHKR